MEAVSKENGHTKNDTVTQCECCCNCASSGTPASSRRGSGTSTEEQDVEIEMTAMRRPTTQTTSTTTKKPPSDLGRQKIARILTTASAVIATEAHRQIEKGGFKHGAKTAYPETPGERYKNSHLPQHKAKYKRSSTPDNRSRAGSFVSSSGSVDNGEGSSRMPRSPTRHSVPTPTATRPISRQNHANSLPDGGLFESRSLHPPSPGVHLNEWSARFGMTSNRTSRAPSLSESVSPTTLSPVIQLPMPAIVISTDESTR